MTRVSAFVGVTGLVVTGFLLLARLSQRVVDDQGAPRRGERPPGPGVEPGADGADRGETPVSGPDAREPLAAEQIRGAGAGTGVDPDDGLSAGALLANVALTQGLFGGLLAAAAWYFAVPATALGLSGGAVTGPGAVVAGVAFGVVLWCGNELATGLADAVGATYDEDLRTTLAPDGAGGWALLLGATLPTIALVEEFLFRAAAVGAPTTLVGGTDAVVAAWALAVVSSVAFALGHGAQGRVGVVVTGALGFALAAGFVVSGSFVVVVVAHYLVNALEFVLHEGVGLPDPVWS